MFKNLTIFRFPPATGMDILCRLSAEIPALPLLDLAPAAMATAGFTPPDQCEELEHWIGATVNVCIGLRKRVIAPKTVAEILERKCKEIDREEGRTPSSRERKRMRDEIVQDLMPHAPIVTKRIHCLIHTGENWIALDTASPQTAESCVGLIRQALGSFPAMPLAPNCSVRNYLTSWLSGDRAMQIAFGRRVWNLGDDCKLIGEDESVSTYSSQELNSDEIEKNLEAGKHVKQIGIMIRDHVRGTLTTDLVLKRVKLLDGCAFDDVEDHAGMMALQALELSIVVEDVLNLFQCEAPE